MTHFSFASAYSRFSLVLLAISIVTLLPQYGRVLEGDSTVSVQAIVHGILFLLWYILFCAQTALIAAGETGVHRTLGYASLALALVLVVSGTGMLIGAIRAFSPEWSEQYQYARISLTWGIYHTLISFVFFYTLGVVYRRRTQIHKRLMLMTCLCMISASITRIAYLPMIPIEGTAFTLLSTYTLLAVPLVIDWVQQRAVHPVLLYGVPIYIISQLVFIAFMPTTELGRALAVPL